jgi:phosphatidylglycerophosphate synthase
MTLSALVLSDAPTRLWGLSSMERLRRQIREIGEVNWLGNSGTFPDEGEILLLNGRFLFETRTLKGLVGNPGSVLVSPDGTPAAAFVAASRAQEVWEILASGSQRIPDGLRRLELAEMAAFNVALRSARPPVLERITEQRKNELENLLYGNAYRGITDLVTKFVFPRPARMLVHLCARLGLTPNVVTSIGFLLVLLACYFFLEGQYVAGLVAGWVMTLLDTVDGKLARVTVRSSRFGHLYDHLIDLVHPPFWYVFWGMSLVPPPMMFGLDLDALSRLLIAAYAAGRIVEVIFNQLGNCTIFTWRPFDAWFRLVTARRNPCMILLTLSVLLGRPDWGFLSVVGWTALTTTVMIVRLLRGILSRMEHGPLTSWLGAENVATGPHALSFRVFGGTRGAFKA